MKQFQKVRVKKTGTIGYAVNHGTDKHGSVYLVRLDDGSSTRESFRSDELEELNSDGKYYFTIPEGYEAYYEDDYTPPQCECGAEVAEVPFHSTWCALYKNPMGD